MRKHAVWFVVVVALLAVVSGVMAQESTPEAAAPVIAPAACAEPGELTMWVWDENWATTIGAAIADWEANYCPGATVDLQVQPWGQYWDLLRTNIAGGDLPDVFNMSQDRFPFYVSNDAILDLQPYFDQAGIVPGDIWGSGMIDPYRHGENDDLYAVPVNWDTVAIFYNKDLFDAAGLAYPTAGWTWDDFAAAARALTNPAEDVYGAAVYSEYQSGYANWIAATGDSPIVDAERTECTLDNPGSLEALNFLGGLYTEGVMPSISTMGGSNANDAFNFWLAGRVAMVSGGSWKLPDAFSQATFNWDVVQLPVNPTTERTRSIVHSVGYVASSQTANPDLAANLILFLGSDIGQTYFAQGGGVAPANPATQQVWLDSFGDSGEHDIQAFVNALNDSQGITVFDEIWDTINTEMVISIFDLNIPVEEAVATACAQIEESLAQ